MISTETQDRRIRRTRQSLATALIDLTVETAYEEVTIRDITERADVGYATFFRHYHDKDALLQDVLDVVLDELMSLLSLEVADPDDDPQTVGVAIFRYVQAHGEVVRVLLGSRTVLHRLVSTATREIVSGHQARPGAIVPLEIAAHHIVSSTIALISWWLAEQMPYPPEQMGPIYARLIARPTSLLAFQGDQTGPPSPSGTECHGPTC